MEKHTEEFIKEMREVLLAEKVKVEADLSRFAKPTETEGDYETQFEDIGRDPEDNAHEVETYESDLAMEQTLEKRLADIGDALEKMENGTYGISEKSGERIPEDRLRAFPEARVCADE
jgi:RNA polymerase-binding transcription factor DksA